MSDALTQLFQKHARAFQSGDLETIAADYAVPLAVFIGGQVRLEQTREDILEFIFLNRGDAMSRGARIVRPRIRRTEEPRNGRTPVLVAWRFEKADGSHVATGLVRYFCLQDLSGTWRIEMVEYLRVAFPVDRKTRPSGGPAH